MITVNGSMSFNISTLKVKANVVQAKLNTNNYAKSMPVGIWMFVNLP